MNIGINRRRIRPEDEEEVASWGPPQAPSISPEDEEEVASWGPPEQEPGIATRAYNVIMDAPLIPTTGEIDTPRELAQKAGEAYENIGPSGGQFLEGLATMAGSPLQTIDQMRRIVAPEGQVPFAPVAEGALRGGAQAFFGDDAEEWIQKNIIGGAPTKESRLVQEMTRRPMEMAAGLSEGNLDPIIEYAAEDPVGVGVDVATSLIPATKLLTGTKVGSTVSGVQEAINPLAAIGAVGRKTKEAFTSGPVQDALRVRLGSTTGVGQKPLVIAEEAGRAQGKKFLGTATDKDLENLSTYQRGRQAGQGRPDPENLAGEPGLEAAAKLVAKETEIGLKRKASQAWRRSFRGVKLKDPKNPVNTNNIRADVNKLLIDKRIGVSGWAEGKTKLDFSGITAYTKTEQKFIKELASEFDQLKTIAPDDYPTMHVQLRKIRKIKDKAVREGWGDTEKLANAMHGVYRKELGGKLDKFNEAQGVFREVTDFADLMAEQFLGVTSKKGRKRALRAVKNVTVSRLNNVLSDRAEDAQRLATLEELRDAFGGADLPRYLAGIQLSRKGPKGIVGALGTVKGTTGAGTAGFVVGLMLGPGAGIGTAAGVKAMQAAGTMLANMTIRSPKNVGRFYQNLGLGKEVVGHLTRKIEDLQKLYPDKGPDFLDTITIGEAIELAKQRDPDLKPGDDLTKRPRTSVPQDKRLGTRPRRAVVRDVLTTLGRKP